MRTQTRQVCVTLQSFLLLPNWMGNVFFGWFVCFSLGFGNAYYCLMCRADGMLTQEEVVKWYIALLADRYLLEDRNRCYSSAFPFVAATIEKKSHSPLKRPQSKEHTLCNTPSIRLLRPNAIMMRSGMLL